MSSPGFLGKQSLQKYRLFIWKIISGGWNCGMGWTSWWEKTKMEIHCQVSHYYVATGVWPHKPFWRVLWNISKKQKGKHFITYWLPFLIGQARVYTPTHLGSMCVDAEQFPMVFAHKGCAGLKICVTPNLVKAYPKLVTVAIGRVRGGAKTTSWWAKEVSNILLPPHCQVGYIQGQYNIMSHFIELLHQAARLLILAKTSAVAPPS